jgi:uncharacterized protein YdhG (YjbR/CyaY superfamily)
VRNHPRSVDEYIAGAPRELRPKLEAIRKAILETAPGSEEGISYGMPYYNFKGRLAWFGLHTTHIGLYLRPPVIQDHEKELKGFVTTKSAVHLPFEGVLPLELIKKLVKSRLSMNEADPEG